MKKLFYAIFRLSPVLVFIIKAGAQSPIPPGAVVEKVAGGFQFTEGPVWRGGGLYFSDINGNTVYLWTAQAGAKPYLAPSGNANGLAFDLNGRLLLALQGGRKVIRLEPDGTQTLLAERYTGKRLNSPNDLAVRPDGAVFFTDPPYGISAGQAELGFSGIYRIGPSGNLQLLDKTLSRPNGIVFSPDGKKLFVSDAEVRVIYVWDVVSDSLLSNRRQFASIQPAGYADGMKADASGNLYVAGPLGIWVFSPAGAVLDTVPVPGQTTNCGWGDADGKTLYITSGPAVYRIRADASGVERRSGGGAGMFDSFGLRPNFPNPFNPSTLIGYCVPLDGWAVMKIFDSRGREVRTLLDGYMQAGEHETEFTAAGLASGAFICSLQSSGMFSYRKMVLMK
jgi:gluconolactonase